MRKWNAVWLIAVFGLVAIIPLLRAQTPARPPAATSSASVEHAIDLAAKGRCEETLPTLKRQASHLPDKQLWYRAQMAIARCAMSLGEDQTAVNALFALKRDFPNDPEVLYITTHFLSELAMRASQQLAGVAPTSYQARELEAEAFESQNKWEEAAAIYRKILEEDPKVPGIHFRLGRVALSQPSSPASVQDAQKEFQQELVLDPANASAEFWLGEIARRNGQWDDAIPHFTSASKLDPSFAEAYLALGMTLNSAGRFADATPHLERYVKMVPADPAGHYQLSVAYARTGRKQDATREMSVQQELAQKNPGGVPKP
jgi:tetratricopeptide (TPR) repeat protein